MPRHFTACRLALIDIVSAINLGNRILALVVANGCARMCLTLASDWISAVPFGSAQVNMGCCASISVICQGGVWGYNGGALPRFPFPLFPFRFHSYLVIFITITNLLTI